MSQYHDPVRYPTLSDTGAQMLKFMSEHPSAPTYRNKSGNRLNREDIDILASFEERLRGQSIDWKQDQLPNWLDEYVAQTFEQVPFYRSQGATPMFYDIEPVTRNDLSHNIAAFVPDSINLDRLLQFSTTGTSGNPMMVASHPRVAAMYLSFHRRALRRHSIELEHNPERVGVVLVGFQQRSFTYISVTPQLGGSGLAKINLHENDWKKLSDRATYLDALNPEVYTGDPLSLTALMEVPITTQPKALISVGMMLSPGLKKQLESHFSAPVLDIYSMNEAGPIATYDAPLDGHILLQPELYIEILDEVGNPVPVGSRGEITLTGGFNFCLPLLRYRTGDFASLEFTSVGPMLKALAGRKPIRFKSSNGHWINNIEITHALKHIPLAQFSFHQSTDMSCTLSLAPASTIYENDCVKALSSLFDSKLISVQPIQVEDKVIQYSSDLDNAAVE